MTEEDGGPSPGSDGTSRTERAEVKVKKHMMASLTVGLVPLPVVDIAALGALQLHMLAQVSKLYEVDFSKELGRSAIASLLGGGTTVLASTTSVRHVLKLITVNTWLVSAVSTGMFAGASTYAIGRVFIQHFDSGGTLLTFDPQKVRAYYTQQLQHGNTVVRQSFAGVQP